MLDGKLVRGPVAAVVRRRRVRRRGIDRRAACRADADAQGHVGGEAKPPTASQRKRPPTRLIIPERAPTDLPSIIGQGVATSVQSAVAAINPSVRSAPAKISWRSGPSGASVKTVNGVTVATGPNGATTTIYPPDASGRSRVVVKSPNGATMVTYADASDARADWPHGHDRSATTRSRPRSA